MRSSRRSFSPPCTTSSSAVSGSSSFDRVPRGHMPPRDLQCHGAIGRRVFQLVKSKLNYVEWPNSNLLGSSRLECLIVRVVQNAGLATVPVQIARMPALPPILTRLQFEPPIGTQGRATILISGSAPLVATPFGAWAAAVFTRRRAQPTPPHRLRGVPSRSASEHETSELCARIRRNI